MKSILVYFDSMGSAGGVERVISNLFNSLCEKYDITILTCDETASFYKLDERIKHISLYNPRSSSLEISKIKRIIMLGKSIFLNHRKLRKIAKDYDYWYSATPLASFELLLIRKNAKKKLVVSEHASYYAFNNIFKKMRSIVYPHAYCISVPTTMDTEIYKDLGYNAIYIPHQKTFDAFDRDDKIQKNALNVGRLTEDKQQLLLLNVWKSLSEKKALNGWKLKIVGAGELKGLLSNYIVENELQESVELLGTTSNIASVYLTSDIFLFTSKMEGFGMVLLEAMSFGLPCISFDCPSGPRDIIKNDKTGYLVECYDLLRYEEKVLNLLQNEDLIKEMRKKSIQKVRDWDNEEILNKWYEIFK